MAENQDGYLGLYRGEIEVGMTFIWEPNKPRARQVVKVVRIDRAHDDARIWTSAEVWNEESRFREAVIDVSDIIESKEGEGVSNITRIKRPSVIWVCGCGCSSFNIREDGEAECCVCSQLADADGQGWYDRTKDAHQRSDDLDGPIDDVSGNGSMEFVRRRVEQLASDKTAVLLVVAREDGSVSTWSIAETEDQVEWVREKLEAATNLVRTNVKATQKAKSTPPQG